MFVGIIMSETVSITIYVPIGTSIDSAIEAVVTIGKALEQEVHADIIWGDDPSSPERHGNQSIVNFPRRQSIH